jgi:NAD(P)-dependent dehydrogenase (short-subunit alcohol dehydrogenase family)
MNSPDLPSFELGGRRAMVTGAGRGIGEGCALALAAAGADLVLVSRSAAELESVAERVRSLGREAQVSPCDVTDAAAVASCVEAAGRLDVLVNGAGTNVPEPFVEVSEEHYDAIMAVNVKGTVLVSQAVVRSLRKRGAGGSLINVSSQMGHIGDARRSVYCASKHAIEGLTKALAVELAPDGIRVNSVAPTYIETPMTRPFFEDPAFRTRALERIPLGRIGTVQDVTGAVVYLASPASSLVTGTSLLVDGGYTAR